MSELQGRNYTVGTRVQTNPKNAAAANLVRPTGNTGSEGQ
jgi:hypothetical protein